MLDQLRQFLIQAKSKGYASGEESVTLQETDASKSTRFERDGFSFHDNWFGGEPFGGREVVWQNNKPLWMMVYYGSDSGKAPNLIPFLLKSLSQLPQEMPLRGPKKLTEGDFTYINEWHGDITQFSGQEKILYKGEEVFYTKYIGGLIDQQKD